MERKKENEKNLYVMLAIMLTLSVLANPLEAAKRPLVIPDLPNSRIVALSVK